MRFLLARLAATAALFVPAAAQAQGADPQGSGPIVAALAWMQGTLLGTVATAATIGPEPAGSAPWA